MLIPDKKREFFWLNREQINVVLGFYKIGAGTFLQIILHKVCKILSSIESSLIVYFFIKALNKITVKECHFQLI